MSPEQDNLAVDAQHVRKLYGELVAVDDVSFQVRRGEVFGLLGPNGAGKTSTIRMAYGFSPLGGGSLHVLGLDIVRDWRAVRARVGVCQQENNLDTDIAVRPNLEIYAGFFGLSRAAARARAAELLQFMGLEHRAKDPVRELSGGMMRRLQLARALLNEPELLILDEPSTGLDPQSRHQVWDRLAKLKQRGVSILLTTHYMEEAAQLCDRLVIVDHGRVLVEGTPRELVARHAGSRVIEASPVSDELRAFVRERGLEHDDLGERLIVFCRDDEDLFRAITEKYCRGGCTLRMGTLEDVFLKLTGRELRE